MILGANIVGMRNVFEAAWLCGVKRVVWASSDHAVGFYRRDETIDHTVYPKPDSRYGVSKVSGEAMGSLYADRYGQRGRQFADWKRFDQTRGQAAPLDLDQPARSRPTLRHRARSSGHPVRNLLWRLGQCPQLVRQPQCGSLRIPSAG